MKPILVVTVALAMVIPGCADPSSSAGHSSPSAIHIAGEPMPSRAPSVPAAAGPLGAPFSSVISVEPGPTELALGPGSSTLYATTSSDGSITAIDTRTSTVGARYVAGRQGGHLATSVSGDRVYVATGEADHSVAVVDTATGVVASQIGVRVDVSDSDAQSMVLGSRTGMLYRVSNGRTCYIAKIDTVTNAVTARIPIVGYGYDLALDEERDTLYVGGSTAVQAVDTTTGRTTVTAHLGTQVGDLALDAATRTLYALNSNIKSLSVIDLEKNRVETTISFQYRPAHIALDNATKIAYVTANGNSSAGDGNSEIYIIDTDENKLVDTYRIADARLGGMVVDPTSRTVYVAVPNRGAVAVLKRSHR